MALQFFTQRQWWYIGRWIAIRLAKRARRPFLRSWDAFYDFWNPLRTFVFYCQHPLLWWRVRSDFRLLRRTGHVRVSL